MPALRPFIWGVPSILWVVGAVASVALATPEAERHETGTPEAERRETRAPEAERHETGTPAAERPVVLMHPRWGNPALIHPGESLVVQVALVVPVAVTLGVQQARALEDFGGELVGHAWGTPTAALRYRLAPARLSAVSTTTCLYELSLPVPAWAAPGVYTLRVHGPGGADVATGAVRLLGSAREVVRRALPPEALGACAEGDRACVAELAVALWAEPVDVWELPAGAPVLAKLRELGASAAGAGLLPPLPLVDEVAARAEAGEARPRAAPVTALWPADAAPVRLADSGVAGVELNAHRDGAPRRLVVVLGWDQSPDNLAEWPEAAVFPGTDLTEHAGVPSLALVVTLGGSGSRHLRWRRREARPVSVRVEPAHPHSGQLVRAEVPEEAALRRVAWDVGRGGTYLGPAIEHRFVNPRPTSLHVLVVDEAGRVGRARVKVPVETWSASGCQAAGAGPPRAFGVWVLCWLGFLIRLARFGCRGGRGTAHGRSRTRCEV